MTTVAAQPHRPILTGGWKALNSLNKKGVTKPIRVARPDSSTLRRACLLATKTLFASLLRACHPCYPPVTARLLVVSNRHSTWRRRSCPAAFFAEQPFALLKRRGS